MNTRLVGTALLVLAAVSASAAEPAFDARAASRFARLALDCLHREYPNKIAHVMNGDADARPPHELTPAFYGCYDWHSSVHGHWLLVRLLRSFPGAPWAREARDAVGRSLTGGNLAAEAKYVDGPGRASFERPYGLAWLLQLSSELHGWDDPDARRWAAALAPLETAAVSRLTQWLPKLSRPVRIGEHDQTAFALGLVLDWAREMRREDVERLAVERSRTYFLNDRACPLAYEPSGEDFLSPCLAEADLMRRVLRPEAFGKWLADFLPDVPRSGGGWLSPAVVTDPSDPKLAHLDGLNLSRAWMLEGIASGLPRSDPRLPAIVDAARRHRQAGLASVTGEHYEGGHWLGSFAVYLVTRRGIAAP
jgi:hypothetical protein